MTTKEIRTYLDKEKGKQQQIAETLSSTSEALKEKKRELRRYEQAKEVIKEVGLKTQQQLQFHISDVASLALGAVFDNPYELIAEFIVKKNKTECDLYFTRDGDRIDPMDASGGGAVDIAAFALRIASWSMQIPHSNNVIVLDEPMKNLSPEFKEKGSIMLKEVSKRLGIQFIIINHEPILTEHADKVFKVSLRNKRSIVEEV